MIHKIEKIGESTYKINETITLEFNETSEKEFLKADYDENLMTENEVNDIINEFVKMIVQQLNISDSVKVSDGTTK